MICFRSCPCLGPGQCKYAIKGTPRKPCTKLIFTQSMSRNVLFLAFDMFEAHEVAYMMCVLHLLLMREAQWRCSLRYGLLMGPVEASFTHNAQNSSCGKVMFSQVCIIPSVHRDGGCGEGGHAWQRWHAWLGGMHSRGMHGRGPCMVGGCMAKGGGGMHAGKTATEVGGMHPTGMHSCV